ncbi:hypothetical protein [Methylobacterium sp. Leaf89]|uniref:hypothetical protein n=1 Tax=Methylobacterium sp. Leaf89 TaxID=1736245 RepID=UPI000AC82992|nr:hypothetical protein [Methylobacterium sp. Leaf89]
MITPTGYVPPRGTQLDGVVEGVARELAKALPLRPEPASTALLLKRMAKKQGQS